MRKYGFDAFTVELVAVFTTRKEAADMETQLIAKLVTRSPAGYNLTDGGDGALGYRHTEEWKAELSRIHSGRKLSPDMVESMRIRQTGRKASQESRDAMARGQTGRKHPENVKLKMREAALRRWAANPKVCTPEEAERLRTLAVGAVRTPEHRAAIRAALTGKPKSAEHRAKLSAAKMGKKRNKQETKIVKINVPSGEYWMGDPGYAFDSKTWDDVIVPASQFENDAVVINLDGKRPIVVFHTAFGDGVFSSPLGDIFVDSASIGLVPVECATIEPEHMYRVTFNEPTVAEIRGDYRVFGPYEIDTNPGKWTKFAP
jgi:hypothetical protein